MQSTRIRSWLKPPGSGMAGAQPSTAIIVFASVNGHAQAPRQFSPDLGDGPQAVRRKTAEAWYV